MMTVRDPHAGFHEQLCQSVQQALSSIPLFKSLDKEERSVMARYMNSFDLPAGDVLFLEGEPGEYVCFVAQGELEVSKNLGGKKRTVIATLCAGQSIGEMSIIDDFPRSANVVAKTDARLLTLTRRDFNLLVDADPVIGNKLLKAIARVLSANLRKTSSQLAESLLPVL